MSLYDKNRLLNVCQAPLNPTISTSGISNGRVLSMTCKLFVEFKKEYQKYLLHSLAEYKQNVMKTLNLKASRKEKAGCTPPCLSKGIQLNLGVEY